MRPCGYLLAFILTLAPLAALAQEPAAAPPPVVPPRAETVSDPVTELDRLRVENNLLKQALAQRDQALLQIRAEEISRERNSLIDLLAERGLVVDWSTGAVGPKAADASPDGK